MLADCLTKPMDSAFLRKVLMLGKFRIYDDSSALKSNPNRKFSARWIESFEESQMKRKQNECESETG